MSLRILVDMNLSPEWILLLEQAGVSAVHWSTIGDPRADDATIMSWAATHDYVVLTHDLDFGTALALTQARRPSVVQIRTQRVLPGHIAPMLLASIKQYERELTVGALLVVETARNRVRILPL